jgi:hypothetical protein
MRETRKELIGRKEYLKRQLDKAWDTIDIRNKYINQLCNQIRAMGGIPMDPEKQ